MSSIDQHMGCHLNTPRWPAGAKPKPAARLSAPQMASAIVPADESRENDHQHGFVVGYSPDLEDK